MLIPGVAVGTVTALAYRDALSAGTTQLRQLRLRARVTVLSEQVTVMDRLFVKTLPLKFAAPKVVTRGRSLCTPVQVVLTLVGPAAPREQFRAPSVILKALCTLLNKATCWETVLPPLYKKV